MTIHDYLTKAEQSLLNGDTEAPLELIKKAINEIEMLSDYAAQVYLDVEETEAESLANTVRMKCLPGDLT